MNFDKNLKTLRRELERERGAFVFDPDSFKGQYAGFTVEAYRLTEAELHRYGRLATKLRQEFQEKANQAWRAAGGDEVDDGEDLELDVPPIYRQCKKERVQLDEEDLNLGFQAGYH